MQALSTVGESANAAASEPLWIFAYGSLLWRPAFAYAERRTACVRGWSRQFWQGSTDHRGMPGAPGRVVTLAPEAAASCVGAAYRLAPEHAAEVLAALDYRERGGYVRVAVDLCFAASPGVSAETAAPVPGLTYIAHPENPNYLGPAPLPTIAEQVRGARGPSGTNLEYVLRLADALRELPAEDPLLFQLEALLRGSEPPARDTVAA